MLLAQASCTSVKEYKICIGYRKNVNRDNLMPWGRLDSHNGYGTKMLPKMRRHNSLLKPCENKCRTVACNLSPRCETSPEIILRLRRI
jgi:hypothetical protein